ncbi:DNA recombination protein RecT [Shewanella sp. NFH-SH190041]|uniref:recombinase RecT n=1 Tax=Shewanella sp. NFH-SH190041 TaxID=2950245 RepID=UPI0021C30A57|nr:RecT family recombinase [Shewanella sp. NFH-SH190041]BDM64576.1 DNA recombination protein RecT [Shewanella sp. NFH-SH190041]
MNYQNNRQVVLPEARQQLILASEQFFTNAIADHQVKWEQESQFAIQALQNNDYLASVAMANPDSIRNAVANIASIGISLNPALKHAYLVPRKINNKPAVCLDISYMGLMHLAQESGSILWGQARLVYQNDTYENIGLDKAPVHKTNPFSDRGSIVGVYCTVKTLAGDFLTEEMSLAECYAIRDRSEAYKKKMGPWVTDEGEMIRKTVVKRAYKYWPKCERLAEAAQMLNESGEGIREEKEVFEAADSERLSLLEDLTIQVDQVCELMGECQSLDELQATYKGMFRKVHGNAPELEKRLNRCANQNKHRFEVAA